MIFCSYGKWKRCPFDKLDSLPKGAKAKSAQEKKKRKSSKDIERSQGEAAGDRGEAVWEKAGEEKREDA